MKKVCEILSLHALSLSDTIFIFFQTNKQTKNITGAFQTDASAMIAGITGALAAYLILNWYSKRRKRLDQERELIEVEENLQKIP